MHRGKQQKKRQDTRGFCTSSEAQQKTDTSVWVHQQDFISSFFTMISLPFLWYYTAPVGSGKTYTVLKIAEKIQEKSLPYRILFVSCYNPVIQQMESNCATWKSGSLPCCKVMTRDEKVVCFRPKITKEMRKNPIIYVTNPEFACDFITSLSQEDKERFILFFDDLKSVDPDIHTLNLLRNALPRTIISSATLGRSETLEHHFNKRFPNTKIAEFSASGTFVSHVYKELDFDLVELARSKSSYFRTGSFVFTTKPQDVYREIRNELRSHIGGTKFESALSKCKECGPSFPWNFSPEAWINTQGHFDKYGECKSFTDFRPFTQTPNEQLAYGVTTVLNTDKDIAKVFESLRSRSYVFYLTDINLTSANSPFVGLDFSDTIKDAVICDDFARTLSDVDLVQLAGRFGRNGNTCNIFASQATLERLRNFSRKDTPQIDSFLTLSRTSEEQQTPKPIVFCGLSFVGTTRSNHEIETYLTRVVFPQHGDNASFHTTENFSDLALPVISQILPIMETKEKALECGKTEEEDLEILAQKELKQLKIKEKKERESNKIQCRQRDFSQDDDIIVL